MTITIKSPIANFESPMKRHTDNDEAQALYQRIEQLQVLNKIHQSMLVSPSPEAVAKIVLSSIADLLPYPQSSITLPVPRRQELNVFSTNREWSLSLTQGPRFDLDTSGNANTLNSNSSGRIQILQDIRQADLPAEILEPLQA